MTHPGGRPGDPAGQQPAWQPPPGPGTYAYPPIAGSHWPPVDPPSPPYSSDPLQDAVPYPPGPDGARAATNGPAIGALVSALVAIPAYYVYVGFLGSLLGIVLGVIALMQIARSGQKGKAMAIAGIALGALGLFGMGIASALVLSPFILS